MVNKNLARDSNLPLSRFGVLVAQLESIVASAAQQSPDPLLCFDLLSDLISAIVDEPKDSILICQRKCEDALYSLLVLGARRPVRHLASVAMAKVIAKGDPISIYSRASSLQGFLSDGKRSEPQRIAGAAQSLGELYRLFGRKITSGFPETASIASKLMKSNEEFVRKEALFMLQMSVEGCGGAGATAAYMEAFRLIMRLGVGDKSSIVRIAAARCLMALANVGGPGLGSGELENSAFTCVKALNDPISSVRDAFAEALGSIIALGMNPEAQVQQRVKGQLVPPKKLEDGLQRHLVSTFMKASGVRSRELRMSVTLAWVSFLQATLLKYLHPDSELQDFTAQVMDMLRVETSVDAHALACVLYILRVGLVDQMTEPTQRSFSVVLGKQLQDPSSSYLTKVAALRTLSYTFKTLGEVPVEFREVLDDTVVVALSHPCQMVRVEAALTLRALAEVDPTCVSGLLSYGVTTLNALSESISYNKGQSSKLDLDSLHGQAVLLAALVSVSPKLPLGYPARLPHSVLEVCKKMLTVPSRNPGAAMVQKEAGWSLLATLIASVPKEELEDQIFDVLALWAPLFSGNPEHEIQQSVDFATKISVWSAAIDALTAFVRCFVSTQAPNSGILLQPVLVYLSSALSHISFVASKNIAGTKSALDVLVIRTLIAFQSLSDPVAYKNDHPKLLGICSAPYRDPSAYEESSCLRLLLDKRDAWLGPWVPGRDWFEDELRAFQGGKDGLMPCIWDPELPSFPQPETVSKILINQKLLCFGIVFAYQDPGGMQSLLAVIEQSLKVGKKQSWHVSSVNNICVGLLAGLKALLSYRPQQLGPEILNQLQNIFQNFLAEGDLSASIHRASCEGLGLLTRLGSDNFTAKMTKSLLGDLAGTTDSHFAGSISVALGCIHRSAGGMALSSLVPATVSAISSLAKSSVPGLQIWSLHGLLLTIEAAGLSYVSHVQATLNLGLEILLSEENGWVDLQQAVGRLINAIVAVLGPELVPGSNFFSRCKSVVAEISSCEETATLLENIRFTQQLVLFAPQALSVHTHVKTLLPTLSSRQPALRHLAITTLRHLIEKDAVSVIHEQIEETLFHMLDEETDAEIGKLVRSTILRLLYASSPTRPSHWISVCRKLVLAMASRESIIDSSSEQDPTNSTGGDTKLDLGEDDENMVSSSKSMQNQGHSFDASGVRVKRDGHLRYRTRVFAAECLSLLPNAVGNNPLHVDLLSARKLAKQPSSGDWLVLQLQELVSLAYQISTIQFERMQPIGVELLSIILDKFGEVPDPELPGCLILEQYQAQLLSALRSALDMSAGPVLLEAGLQLATKVLICGIIRGDRAAIKRIFSLISLPLSDFDGLYYPSFAEWVSCKIKVRLLAAHASLKCYTYTFLREGDSKVPDEYMALLPLFSKNSEMLGRRWIGVLRDYCILSFNLHLKKNWTPFLEGIKSSMGSSKLKSCLEEACPVLLQAVALDAVPVDANVDTEKSSHQTEENVPKDFTSGYNMVQLHIKDFQFLWGFALFILFQGKNLTPEEQRCQILPIGPAKSKCTGNSPVEEANLLSLKSYEVVLSVFRSLSAEIFFSAGFLTVDICRELLQIFTGIGFQTDSWNILAVTILSQIVHNCPDEFLKMDSFSSLAIELCLANLYKFFDGSKAISPDESSRELILDQLLTAGKTLLNRFESEMQFKAVLAFMLAGYYCARGASTEASFSKVTDFVSHTCLTLNNIVREKLVHGVDSVHQLQMIIGAGLHTISDFVKECIEAVHLLENRRSNQRRLVYVKLAFCLEQTFSLATLVFKMEVTPEKESSMNVTLFSGCISSVQLVVMDANLQVQAIGLQVLKNIIQKNINSKPRPLLLLLSGELFKSILMVVQNIMTKPVTRESAALAGECLRTLVLMQTLPEEVESQKGLVSLLLEAVAVLLSGTEDSQSEESKDLRSMVIRLVSQVALVPSVVIHLKEVMLEMSGTDRLQIQNIIRASVTREHQTAQVKSNVGTLEIKLPRQVEETKEQTSMATPPQCQADNDYVDEEEDEDEDDWDTFQSFPTATSVATTTAGSDAGNYPVPGTHSEDSFQEYSNSLHSNVVKETSEESELAEEEQLILEPPLQNIVHDDSGTAYEIFQSRDSDSTCGDSSNQDAGIASSSFQQQGNSAEDTDAVYLLFENSINVNDIMNDDGPVSLSPVEELSCAVNNSPDLEAINLEVKNKLHEDQSPESLVVDSATEASFENEDVAPPENDCSFSPQPVSEESSVLNTHEGCGRQSAAEDSIIHEDSGRQDPSQNLDTHEDTGRQDPSENFNAHEDSGRPSSPENLNIASIQGTEVTSQQSEEHDIVVERETSEVSGEPEEQLSTETESTSQNQEVPSATPLSPVQAAGDSPGLLEDQDTMNKSEPAEVIERTTTNVEANSQPEENAQPLELSECEAAVGSHEQSEDVVEDINTAESECRQIGEAENSSVS